MPSLLVTNDFPPKHGGIQSYLYELWRRLPPDETTVLTTPFPGAAAWDASVALFDDNDRGAAPASGSARNRGMVICPCSMGTLSAVSVGASRSLVERSADVALKERRTLVLVPRETPLSAIHLQNMLRLSRAGAVIMPAAPGFYNRPQTVAELVDFIVARVLDQLGVEHTLVKRWGSSV